MQLDRGDRWPGLDWYQENAHGSFAHSHEAALLLDQLRDATVTVLYGTVRPRQEVTLLRAGLFPLLRAENFVPVYVHFELRPSATPLFRQLHESVDNTIRAEVSYSMLPSDEESLWEYLHHADFELRTAQNYPLTPVIVLDKFEELFTLGERILELVRVFMNDLGDLAENRIPAELAARIENDEAVAARFHLQSCNYRLLISLREDFLGNLKEWRRIIPALAGPSMRLHRLRADDAFDAVQRPAAHLMTEELARRVVSILGGEDPAGVANSGRPRDDVRTSGVEPALISLFCRELNEDRKRRGLSRFDEQLVEDARRDILSNYYSSCVR